MDVSIIVPHKNNPALLQRCLDSIPISSNMEVIVVDDNSSPDVVDFEHFPGIDRPDTKVLFPKEGKGAGYARNCGLKEATGKWLLFADCDDFFLDNAFLLLSGFINDNADVIYFRSVDLDGKTLQPVNNLGEKYNRNLDAYIAAPTSRNADIFRFGHHVPWAKLIRRSLVDDNNIRFDEVICSNDVVFSTKIALASSNYKIVNEPIYCYLLNDGSLETQRDIKAHYCRYDVQHRKMRLLHKYNAPHCVDNLSALFRRNLGFVKHSVRFGIGTTFNAFRIVIMQDFNYIMKR